MDQRNFNSTKVQTPREKYNQVENCICYEPNGTIMCKICGFIMRGRVRKACLVHPTTIFLMDIEKCPRCKAFSHMLIQIRKKAQEIY